uniref:DUF7027 domain-containing protein n=1 Tax=Plectus sambesii TaxID=2011161 RepID=A0A914W7L5_9BILA
MWRSQIQIVPQGEPTGFNYNSSHYRCCCRCCHVKTGTLIIAMLEAMCALYQLINSIYFISITEEKWRGIVGIVAVVISVVIIALLLFGWMKENAWLLLPHLALQVIAILVTVALICYVYIASDDKVQSTFNVSYDNDGNGKGTGSVASIKAVITLGLVIALGYELFAFTVIFGCYRYFRDKAAFVAGAQSAIDSPQQLPIQPPPQYGFPPDQMMHIMPYPPPAGSTTVASPNGHVQTMHVSPLHSGSLPPPYSPSTAPTVPSSQQHDPTTSIDK